MNRGVFRIFEYYLNTHKILTLGKSKIYSYLCI